MRRRARGLAVMLLVLLAPPLRGLIPATELRAAIPVGPAGRLPELPATSPPVATATPAVFVLSVEGTVTAGTARYVASGIRRAEREGAAAVVLRLNTPGGLVSATLDILRATARAGRPVVVWVAPSGGIAASAGAFILVGAHVAAMAPGTTVGAAMPVVVDPTGGETRAADEKTTRFLAGHMRSVARERGRPVEVAEAFVTENLTLDAREAREQGIADLLAEDFDELLSAIHGREVRTAAGPVTLETDGATARALGMSPGERLQDLVSNPQLAFLLLIGGAYALYLGLSAPGTLVPEVLGAIALLLGIFGLGLFQTNVAGVLLMALGFAFLLAEAFTPTFGALGIGGALALLLGAILLPREPLMPTGWHRAFQGTAAGAVLAAAAISFTAVAAVLRARRQRRRAGPPLEDRFGVATTDLEPEGSVRLAGELWRARAAGGKRVAAGTRVEVVSRDGLLLTVRPAEPARPPGRE